MPTRLSKLFATKLYLPDGKNKGQHNKMTRVTASPTEMNLLDGVTATTDEINAACDAGTMSASTAVTSAIETYQVGVTSPGGVYTTQIILDLTGVKSTTTLNDIIGDTGASHFGQITAAVNGAVQGGRITCLEVPATGVNDIDLSMASVATGAYDAVVTGLTNYASLHAHGGAWALGASASFGPVTANYYLYLSSGVAGTAGTYTAGKFLIEMWGV